MGERLGREKTMRATVQHGAVTYVGFDPSHNDSWVVEDKDDWTYVIYQRDAFTRVISGYVVRQPSGQYRAFNCMETYNKTFKDKQDAIEFVKTEYGKGA